MSTTKRELFGGTIECTLPSTFVSASDIRQTPSYQEVFVHKDLTNTSLIIEILEPIDLPVSIKTSEDKGTKGEQDVKASFEDETMNNMAVAHFEEISAANDAQSYDVDMKSLKFSTNTNNKVFKFQTARVKGTQQVFKFGKMDHLDTVRMWVGVIRVEEFAADIVMSLNSLLEEDVSEEELSKIFEECFESINVVDFSSLVTD